MSRRAHCRRQDTARPRNNDGNAADGHEQDGAEVHALFPLCLGRHAEHVEPSHCTDFVVAVEERAHPIVSPPERRDALVQKRIEVGGVG